MHLGSQQHFTNWRCQSSTGKRKKPHSSWGCDLKMQGQLSKTRVRSRFGDGFLASWPSMAGKALAKSSTTWVNLSHICSGAEMYVICGKTKHTHTHMPLWRWFAIPVLHTRRIRSKLPQRCSEKMEPGSGMEPDDQDMSQNRRWTNSQKIGFL